MAMCLSLWENVTYEFAISSLALSSMSFRYILIFCEMGGQWLYIYIFPLYVSFTPVMHPFTTNDTGAAWKESRFIFSKITDFHKTTYQPIEVLGFVMCMLTSISLNMKLLLSRELINWFQKLATLHRDGSLFKRRRLFYLHSSIYQCPLLLTLGYLAEGQLGHMSLPDALDHLCSPC